MRRSTSRQEGARASRVAAQCRLAPVDEQVAKRTRAFGSRLKRKGRPIPENDIWIAATTAISIGADVLTDDAHFRALRRKPGSSITRPDGEVWAA
jgi:tRNA(fMet)-specific endonuclease VapC